MEDMELIQRIVGDADRGAFESQLKLHASRSQDAVREQLTSYVWEKHREDVARLFAREPAADREDLLAAVYEAVLKGICDFKGQSPIRTWMLAIARHKRCDHWERRQRTAYRELNSDIAARSLTPSAKAAKHEVFGVLRRVVSRLSLEEQELLSLCGDGWSWADIAAMHGRRDSAVRQEAKRLRQKIAAAMIDEGVTVEDVKAILADT